MKTLLNSKLSRAFPNLLKFGTLVHYGSMQAVQWLTFTFGQTQDVNRRPHLR